MKNMTWLLLLVLFISYIFNNDILLSKFHQNSYKIKDFRAELISYNEDYFNFLEIKTFKYNRTTPATNVTFNMKITVKDKLEVVVQGLKFLSNEYRHFPIRFQVNIKKAVNANALGLESIINCGNITTICFEKEITYHACNFVVDETRFPPLIPNGRFQFNQTVLYLNEEIAVVASFLEIYTPIPYPKS